MFQLATNTPYGQPARSTSNIIPFPIKPRCAENAAYAVAQLCRGEPFLCGPELDGPYFPALAFLAGAVRITRGRP